MIEPQHAQASSRSRHEPARKSCGVRNFLVFIAAATMLALVGAACSGDEKRPDSGGYGGDDGFGGGPAGTCKPGAERACGFKVDQSEGVVTCFQGTQECEDDGTWGPCGNGDFVDMPDDKAGDTKDSHGWFKPLVLSTQPHVDCNPLDRCDPRCVEVAEPSATFTPGTSVLVNELCETGDPSPPAECSSGMSAGMKCAHDLCTTGSALTNGCDACVTKVCTARPACCSSTWDSACVAEAYNQCLNSPPPIGLCEFGVYSQTTILTANGPSFGTNSTIGGLGNLIIDTDAAAAFPARVVTPCNIWVKNANIAGPIVVSGGIWAGGSATFDAGSATVWQADMHFGRGLYMNSNNSITGKIYGSANYNLASGTPAGCTGPSGWPPSTTSNSHNLSAQSAMTVTGSAYSAGTMSNISVTPAANKFENQGTTLVPPPTFSLPAVPPSPVSTTCSGATAFPAVATACTSGAGSISGTAPNQTLTINNGVCTLAGPGNYQNITMQNGAKLVLNGAGTYTFKSINGFSANNGGIQIGTPANSTGNYTATVCGKFSLGNNQNIIDSSASTAAATNKTPVLATPSRLMLYVLGTDTGTNCTGSNCAVALGTDVLVAGVLSVPNGTFFASNNNTTSTSLNGALWAKGVNVGTKFNLSQMSKATCESMNIPGTGSTAGMCPWDNTTTITVPAIPGTSVEPCRWGADCQNNQRCTDVQSRVGTVACANFNKCVASGTANGGPSALPCKDDPCVARIIANPSTSSCGTNWTSTCVAAVQTQCDATCGATAAARSGTCVDNTGYLNEPECTTGTNRYDLALGYVCAANQVPVCNHGGVQFSGNVTVGYWNINKRQFATATPSTATMDGSCTQNLTIPAGQCTNITNCSLAAGTSYTLMVDPAGLLSECGIANNANRRMDNWSWREASFTCISNPDYAEYEYVADCEDDSYPSWKHLKWVTDNTASSNVRFYGKVAQNVAGLAAQSYQLLATNTTDCTENDANNLINTCAVSLTSALALTSPQGQALSVRVEKTNSPVLTKWEVSYTCAYDQ